MYSATKRPKSSSTIARQAKNVNKFLMVPDSVKICIDNSWDTVVGLLISKFVRNATQRPKPLQVYF
jgi:hypothetical protein